MDLNLLLDFLKQSPLAVIGVIVYMLWNKTKAYDKHVEECEKTPKQLLIEKLDNLCDRLDDMKQDLKEQGRKLDAFILSKRQHN